MKSSQFDITLAHRLADQLSNCAQSLKAEVQTPEQMQQHLDRINSLINSLHTMMQEVEEDTGNPI
ncbi:hypothetical protein [Aneurinibacillus uraniidurans]|uniref:hypothetical protein n=1 Tax=Aneurinibacillus uraniidurans TaxID=2966586 RepID=UPI0023497045|nr:hypothetical protein [Aneurinibacillus sp. B1]WCN38234.1 hypothetical protein PO771_02115 [Aneurinibacillus sp. B1]